jgi:hypothetical protein
MTRPKRLLVFSLLALSISLAPFYWPGRTAAAGNGKMFLPIVQQPVRPWQDTTASIVVFNDQIDTRALSEALFQFAATHYAGSQKQTRAEASHLRQYNPNYLVLHYRLGQALGHSTPDAGCNPTTAFTQIIDGNNWVQEWPGDSTVQENWFFHYLNGSSREFQCTYGHYLANLDDPGWRAWWSNQVIQQLQDNQDDGVFADSYSIPNYLGPWKPSLPAVDAAFESQWAVREHSFSDYIRSRFSGRWKWIPNIGAFITTRDPSDYSNLDGAMIEGFAEWGGGNYFNPVDWALQQNRVLALVRAGKILIGQSYPSQSDPNERLFILGTYLLVKGSNSYINLETSMVPEWYPEYGLNLGAPLDPLPSNIAIYLSPAWGVYVRHYSRGLVLVNPDAAAHSISLGAAYFQVVPSGGGPVPASGTPPGSLSFQPTSSLALAPHQAAILLTQAP